MKVCTAEESSTLVSQQIECVLSQTFYVANKRKVKCWDSLGIEHRVSDLSHHSSDHWTCNYWTTSSFCIPLYMPILNKSFFQLWQKHSKVCAVCIFVLYFSWHTIPRYFCGGTMLYLWMSARQRLCDILISICMANASALCLWVWRE